MSLKSIALDGVNIALRPAGVQLVKGRTTDPAVKPFRSARKTIAAARRAGLSVGDYIDKNFAEAGDTARTVDALVRLGTLSEPVDRVCEIGPGTGRYAEKVITALRPRVYEAYEPARDWWPHLRRLPNLELQPADGHALRSTATASVDLVQAHKVFVYTPFPTTVGYLQEMSRVVRPGGVVAFDIVTEECLDEQTVNRWAEHGTIFLPVPREWVIGYLERRDLALVGSHIASMVDGKTELLVFRWPKQGS